MPRLLGSINFEVLARIALEWLIYWSKRQEKKSIRRWEHIGLRNLRVLNKYMSKESFDVGPPHILHLQTDLQGDADASLALGGNYWM